MNSQLTLDMLRRGFPVQPGEVLARSEIGRLLKAGPGTTLSDDGTTLMAKAGGLAVVSADSTWVFPAEIYRGDIFRGDIVTVSGNLVVLGAVQADARIKVGGSLGVRGEVQSGRIEVMGSVVLLTGCSNSTVQAGANQRGHQLSLAKLEIMEAELRRFLATVEQLRSHPSFRTMDLENSLEALLRVLVERSFAGLPMQIFKAFKRCQLHEHLGGPLTSLRTLLEERFIQGNLVRTTHGELQEAHRLTLAVLGELVRSRDTHQSMVIMFGATGSTLQATGEVTILQGNCTRTNIEAGTGVRVEGEIQGGSVVANEWIEAVGVSGGGSLEVNGPGEIRADSIKGGTLLRVGHVSTQTVGTIAPASVHLSDGRLAWRHSQEVDQHV